MVPRRDRRGSERARRGTGNVALRPEQRGHVSRDWEPRFGHLQNGQAWIEQLHQGSCTTLDAGSRIISADIAAPYL